MYLCENIFKCQNLALFTHLVSIFSLDLNASSQLLNLVNEGKFCSLVYKDFSQRWNILWQKTRGKTQNKGFPYGWSHTQFSFIRRSWIRVGGPKNNGKIIRKKITTFCFTGVYWLMLGLASYPWLLQSNKTRFVYDGYFYGSRCQAWNFPE